MRDGERERQVEVEKRRDERVRGFLQRENAAVPEDIRAKIVADRVRRAVLDGDDDE